MLARSLHECDCVLPFFSVIFFVDHIIFVTAWVFTFAQHAFDVLGFLSAQAVNVLKHLTFRIWCFKFYSEK